MQAATRMAIIMSMFFYRINTHLRVNPSHIRQSSAKKNCRYLQIC
jgi:hypothetical protein